VIVSGKAWTFLALGALSLAACGGAESATNDETEPSYATSSADETGPPAEGGEVPRATGGAPPESAAVVAPPAMQPLLDAHNRLREAHCAPPLSWSLPLAEQAGQWATHLAASGCNLAHSTSDVGENLAAATAGTLTPEGVAELWYREKGDYDFRRGGFSMRTGHFTQLVWKGTTAMGCGTSSCGGLEIYVCNYAPAGNVQGEYRANVLPTGCAADDD